MILTVTFLVGCATPTKIEQPEVKITYLKRGEPAPADGGFANEPALRNIRALQIENKMLGEALDEAPTPFEKMWAGWKGFVLGFGIGYIANDLR